MDQGDIPLSDREFTRIKNRVYTQAGISLSDAKRTMVMSRLTKIVRRLGLPGFDDYIDYLDRQGSTDEHQEFINALTTNLTRFYREDHHFDHLADYVGKLIASRPRVGPNGRPRLRIWSAGCSTGQEPYTIGMCLLERFPALKTWDFKILATDIDTNVVAKAALGIYPETELNDLTAERASPFERVGDGTIRVPQNVRNLISFKPLNLHHKWPFKGPFDAIFCRNVAIYFDKETQGQLFSRFHEVLAPDGYLYIGHSENIGGGARHFKLVGKTIYITTKSSSTRDVA